MKRRDYNSRWRPTEAQEALRLEQQRRAELEAAAAEAARIKQADAAAMASARRYRAKKAGIAPEELQARQERNLRLLEEARKVLQLQSGARGDVAREISRREGRQEPPTKHEQWSLIARYVERSS